MPYDVLKVIRPVVRIASRVAPRAVGNLAFRAFCVVPKAKDNKRQERVLRQAEARMAGAEQLRVPYRNRHVEGEMAAYRFASQQSPAKGTVLLIHGWTGKAAHMSAFVEPLTRQGYDVVAVDLPGHGMSSGRTLHLARGVAALHALHEQCGPWHGIIAHSFGGAVANALLAGSVEAYPPINVERLVLIATPHSMIAIFQEMGRVFGLSDRSQIAFEGVVPRLTGRELSAFEATDQLRAARIPTLVLHAPDDKEVPYRSAEIMATAGEHVRLTPLAGLGHRRIIFAAATVDQACAFVDDLGLPVHADMAVPS